MSVIPFLIRAQQHPYTSVGLSYYKSNYQDPNISHQGGEDDSEAEDFEVQASDFVILAARNEDEVSHIEVRSASHTLSDVNVYTSNVQP